ncbi:MAG TPA: S24 family peptidase [Methylophilus sp.]|nr:S24 family peptidase [Methylophilus sp.]
MQPIPISQNPPPVSIPFIEEIRYLPPFISKAEIDTLKKVDLYQLLVTNPETTFAFKVAKDDDSMVDAHIPPKSWLIVDKAKGTKARSSDIVIAIINGKYVVKRLYKHSKVIRLLAENKAKAYPPIEFSEVKEFLIWGVVEHVIISFL